MVIVVIGGWQSTNIEAPLDKLTRNNSPLEFYTHLAKSADFLVVSRAWARELEDVTCVELQVLGGNSKQVRANVG
jgi:hypothetical protein